MFPVDRQAQFRLEAFRQVRERQERRGLLDSHDLKAGFIVDGRRYPLVNPQRGIFKPKEMEHLLSIRTVFPKPGAKVWYDDQKQVHQQIYAGDETVEYAFMGTDPEAADNRWLRAAMLDRVPVIYFLGVAPGRYQAVIPTFIVEWDPQAARARVAFAAQSIAPDTEPPATPMERRYALGIVQHRLHQATFRAAVISAYRGRCALSGLPEPLLLDAAHIIADGDERLGQPVVPNGIPLSKIHHAAFDAHLIGIDPDYRVHVADRLLGQSDGPMLEALKTLHKGVLHLPDRMRDRPDRDRLAVRFDVFRRAA